MSTLAVNTITNAAGGNTATINGMTPTAQSLQGFRNRIINGDMRIDQRNAGASVSFAANTSGYTLDRWNIDNSTDGSLTVQQSTVAPAGFPNSILVTVTSADSSLASGQRSRVFQRIEGFNFADFAWGTANASAATISFWVRSSLTGTFGGALRNASSNRSYAFTYAISAANTWEYKTVNISGDTTGTWATGNTSGVEVGFGFGASSDLSGTAGTWTATANVSATGATSVVGTNGATFYITGVQLEAGSVATPFERRDYGRELMMCQRYYIRFGAGLSSGSIGQGLAGNVDRFQVLVPLPVEMRATPSVSGSNLQATDHQNNFAVTAVNVMSNQTNRLVGLVEASTSGSMVQFRPYQLRCAQNTAGFLDYSAEL
jgi:hypothetical protein